MHIINIWTNDIDITYIRKGLYTGLGDVIRGTILLYQLSKQYNFELIVDISQHPLSKLLEHKYLSTNKNNITYECIKNIKEITDIKYFHCNGKKNNDVEKFISNCNKNSIYIITNEFCNINLSKDCKDFIKKLLTPNQEMKLYYDNTIKTFNIPNIYKIIHVRLGDSMFSNNSLHLQLQNTITTIYNKIKSILNPNDNYILLSDSHQFKNFVKQQQYKNINVYDTDICHVGLSRNPHDLKDTMFDFYLTINSSEIFTYSVYTWISGFVYWPHVLYDIKLNELKNHILKY